jgi:hypothetical protein
MVRKERFVGQVEGLEEWPILGLKVRLKLSAFPDLVRFLQEHAAKEEEDGENAARFLIYAELAPSAFGKANAFLKEALGERRPPERRGHEV